MILCKISRDKFSVSTLIDNYQNTSGFGERETLGAYSLFYLWRVCLNNTFYQEIDCVINTKEAKIRFETSGSIQIVFGAKFLAQAHVYL